jgi:phosphatidylinositol-3,4,5-trisphosphate 3-phosphatase and dual-specificity protein phosphatase PTEN
LLIFWRHVTQFEKNKLNLKDAYYLYNLCEGRENDYPHDLFKMRVCVDFGFEDHQAPPFEKMEKLCKHVLDWLRKSDNNVVVIHCKAGKGRTGLMICCVLIYSGFKALAEEAMDYYAVERTRDLKGVNIPSQRRYVEYFGLATNQYGGLPPFKGQKLKIKKITMNKSPKGGISFSMKIRKDGNVIYNHQEVSERKTFKEKDSVLIENFDKCPDLDGDVHFEVRDKQGVSFSFFKTTSKKTPFKFWLNTYFVEDNYQKLTKFQLDKVWNDKKSKVVADDFYMEIFFEQTQKPEDVPKVDRVINLDVNFFPDRSKLTKEEATEIDEIYAKYGKLKKDDSVKEEKIMKMETMEEKLEREEEEEVKIEEK